MRAEPSISPVTVGICLAVVAGALALAPTRGMSPAATWRGGDVAALEAASMTRGQGPTSTDDGADEDGANAAVDVPAPTAGQAAPPQGGAVAASCTHDCGDGPAPTGGGTGTPPEEGPPDGPGDDRRAGEGTAGSDPPAPGDPTSGAEDPSTSSEDANDVDSCRSPRAVAARDDGPDDVAPPSPCSRGHHDDPCRGAGCDERRSSGSTEV